MNFPHPVLAEWRDDFDGGQFDVEIAYREDKGTGRIDLVVEAQIKCPDVECLIEDGKAIFGVFVLCQSTGLRQLIQLGMPKANYTFEQGALLGRVILRPLVWTSTKIDAWNPIAAHEEFVGNQTMRCGDIVAMAPESSIDVNQAELPALETIFELQVVEEMEPGEFDVDLDRDKITILTSRQTYGVVELLRGAEAKTQAVVMNALYVPVVMTVLSQVASDSGEGDFTEFEGYRWVAPFRRRCEKLGINHQETEVHTDALKLLEKPFHLLEKLAE